MLFFYKSVLFFHTSVLFFYTCMLFFYTSVQHWDQNFKIKKFDEFSETSNLFIYFIYTYPFFFITPCFNEILT